MEKLATLWDKGNNNSKTFELIEIYLKKIAIKKANYV